MRRKFLCGLAASMWASGLAAQSVPARDLWEFPLGAVLEPAALATEPGGGLWNPATARLGASDRWRIGVASVLSETVDGKLLSTSYRRGNGVTLGLSLASSTVPAIIRTDTDPTKIGDVPYSSLLVSLTAARDILPHVTAGIALRYREGRADQDVNNALAADLGVVVHHLPLRDARLALASFLWRPGREIQDRPAVIAAGDLRLMGIENRETRVGYSFNGVNRGAKEYGPFIAWRFDRLDLRGAYLQTSASGRRVSRIRSGIGLHYARYVVGVAREEGASGLGPLYQFTLSSLVR